MKKNTIKAFTLVEMLIVIVIIGILIAALMPRMQAAQGRARDVSRKTALSQIQSAIVVSQGDKGKWPGMGSGATGGIAVSVIAEDSKSAGMNNIPVDPLKSDVTGLGRGASSGDYAYLVTYRNGTKNGGFVLMAKTEVEGGSNWVYCNNTNGLSGGYINGDSADYDITKIHPCTKFEKVANATDCKIEGETCYYDKDGELRYILLY